MVDDVRTTARSGAKGLRGRPPGRNDGPTPDRPGIVGTCGALVAAAVTLLGVTFLGVGAAGVAAAQTDPTAPSDFVALADIDATIVQDIR